MIVLLLLILSVAAWGQDTVTIVGWNVQSGDADPEAVANRMAAFTGVDVWGLSEVMSAWEPTLTASAGVGEAATFASVLGTTGGADRLLLIHDTERLELLEYQELHHINLGGSVRSPLVARYRLRGTGQEFRVMVNHLYRTNDQRRREQSELLSEWAATVTTPLLAIGDYNYDWRVEDGEDHHDEGFDLLTADRHLTWLRPAVLVRTQYAQSYAAAVLDFAFLADPTGVVGGASRIVVEPGDFPDDTRTPDHRPIKTVLVFAGVETPVAAPVTRDQLLWRIDRVERELSSLRTAAAALPPPE
jgi:endonuclease/exonuclease/phosphatase family metal-dependent hydrolase